jgi:hypothetical protein
MASFFVSAFVIALAVSAPASAATTTTKKPATTTTTKKATTTTTKPKLLSTPQITSVSPMQKSCKVYFKTVAGADAYRANAFGGPYTQGTSSPLTVTGLANHTAYAMVMQAHNAAGWSGGTAADVVMCTPGPIPLAANPGTTWQSNWGAVIQIDPNGNRHQIFAWPDSLPQIQIGAMGFNVQDNYLYAITVDPGNVNGWNSHLIRIGKNTADENSAFDDLGVPRGLWVTNGAEWRAGEIDQFGRLWLVMGGSRMFKVDIGSNTATIVNIGGLFSGSDVVFGSDGNLYTAVNRTLMRTDLDTGATSSYNIAGNVLPAADGYYGEQWVIGHDLKVHQTATTHYFLIHDFENMNGSVWAERLPDGPLTSTGDGASIPPELVPDTTTTTIGFAPPPSGPLTVSIRDLQTQAYIGGQGFDLYINGNKQQCGTGRYAGYSCVSGAFQSSSSGPIHFADMPTGSYNVIQTGIDYNYAADGDNGNHVFAYSAGQVYEQVINDFLSCGNCG